MFKRNYRRNNVTGCRSTETCVPQKNHVNHKRKLIKKIIKKLVCTYMAYFRRMRSETGLSRESFSADVTMERTIFCPFYLSIVIPQVLLEVGELDKSATAVRQMAFVRPLTCNRNKHSIS